MHTAFVRHTLLDRTAMLPSSAQATLQPQKAMCTHQDKHKQWANVSTLQWDWHVLMSKKWIHICV